ncbi:2-C-methyl-D-erythritol 4-phosphate cytidylyltransferase [Alkanindiges illinoisensis]|uniref:2-C-methyl-D-erythritol 4-phosphate cytidylyltransferase n=1 Tax=Alkanindiges illinoisensis TaxID=197183 RepID=UPI000478BB9D|nr:2-C-methyl-D-erythritol 4-phosphate cytidylyltransferase [Alkanindiges illinoisensis]
MKLTNVIMPAQYWAILPAAGSGSRFASSIPKQYLTLINKTVIQHSVDRICQLPLQGCVLAISAHDQTAKTLTFAKPALLHWVTGGAERMDSVLAAMQYLQQFATAQDWVLVHDVARPCILANDLQHLLDELKEDAVGGLLAVPVRDTLKRGNAGQVVETVPRDHLWQCQTPQMFRFGLLLDALQQAKTQQQLVTDEAGAIEQFGLPVKLVNGSSTNIKITYPEDLGLAAAILKAQTEENLI